MHPATLSTEVRMAHVPRHEVIRQTQNANGERSRSLQLEDRP
jgi:hypothetical protein